MLKRTDTRTHPHTTTHPDIHTYTLPLVFSHSNTRIHIHIYTKNLTDGPESTEYAAEISLNFSSSSGSPGGVVYSYINK